MGYWMTVGVCSKEPRSKEPHSIDNFVLLTSHYALEGVTFSKQGMIMTDLRSTEAMYCT